jgi:hypothetical protein
MIVERGPIGGERHPDELPGAHSQRCCRGAAKQHLDDVLADAVDALYPPILSPHSPWPYSVHQYDRTGGKARK